MNDHVARIERKLQATLNPESLEVGDQSHLHAGHAGAKSGGGHFDVNIISAQFTGLNQIQRHRLIYQALGTMMQSDIHALSITALAPDEI